MDGSFVKETEFERVWVAYNVHNSHDVVKSLDDQDFLDYSIWKDQHANEMYKKHSPKSIVFRGRNPNIIFHGACLGCLSQRLNGLDRCKGCLFFRFKTDLPDLRIEGEECSKITGQDLTNLLKGE